MQREVGTPTSLGKNSQSRAGTTKPQRMSRWRGCVMIGTEVMDLFGRDGRGSLPRNDTLRRAGFNGKAVAVRFSVNLSGPCGYLLKI